MRCARGRRRTGRSASASPSARVQSSRRPRSACSICSSAPARTSSSCSRKPSSSGLRHSTPLVSHGSTSEVIKSLVVNVAIAVAKGIAAVISGSGAMLAETLHSFADCGNQILLLVGARSARRPADDKHPLGYGRAMYYYSFIVALLLFFGGGVFSVREGWEKIRHPEPVESITLATAILAFSFLLEGWSLYGNIKEINKRRGDRPDLRDDRARAREGDGRWPVGRRRLARDRPGPARRRDVPRPRGQEPARRRGGRRIADEDVRGARGGGPERRAGAARPHAPAGAGGDRCGAEARNAGRDDDRGARRGHRQLRKAAQAARPGGPVVVHRARYRRLTI